MKKCPDPYTSRSGVPGGSQALLGAPNSGAEGPQRESRELAYGEKSIDGGARIDKSIFRSLILPFSESFALGLRDSRVSEDRGQGAEDRGHEAEAEDRGQGGKGQATEVD